MLEGARLLEAEQPNPHWLLELIELPKPLPVGTEHRFAMMHDTEDMAPMWTATSHHDMDELCVRVWYADGKARDTWLIDDFPANLLLGDDIEPVLRRHAQTIDVDRLGNANFKFSRFKRGRSYGLAWTNP